ncbi:hypothetical protein BN1180_02869 [Peribacillus simplex]|uniref:Uncharacterized protein n=1 Tax=Peribacillus simplex TaxID=1478 RepID=A0AAN2PHQ0_9BACI|nr:hypothetical protein BN1180_02869 [Peribacillus simplex]
MRMLPSLLILFGTYLLIMLLDKLQGLNLLHSFYSIKQYLIVARGEDYFLLLLFTIIFIYLIIFSAFKNRQPPSS